MKNGVFILLILLSGCRKNADPTPKFIEPPMGTSYLLVETDNQKKLYQEGENGIDIWGSFATSTQHENKGMGAEFTNANDATHWRINFFFSEDELTRNTGNFPQLFHVGAYDFIRLDKQYNYSAIRGVEIETCKRLSDQICEGGSTAYQQNEKPQAFEVKNAYFYLTHDRFIWVEGTFDCWLNNASFGTPKRVKGQFRIKVQHDLQ